jgi:CHAT domain
LLLARFPRPLAEPVLSACDTAEAADGPALAHALVAGGIPAVVGMRRLVDLTDANRFCAALYPEVLAAIRTAVAADGPPGARTIDCRPE